MTYKESLYYILAPVFNNEIYPVVHPDPDGLISSVSSLYAVYNVVGGSSFNTLEGTINISRPRIQISIYGLNADEVAAKQLAVDTAMQAANVLYNQCVDTRTDFTTVNGALPNISSGVPPDGYEADTKRFYVHLDYYVWSVS